MEIAAEKHASEKQTMQDEFDAITEDHLNEFKKLQEQLENTAMWH